MNIARASECKSQINNNNKKELNILLLNSKPTRDKLINKTEQELKC